jgi:hypothetical protein
MSPLTPMILAAVLPQLGGSGQPVQLGAHTLLGQEDGLGANPAVTAPIDTAANGSSFVAFSAGYASNTLGPTDNFGNVFAPLGSPVVYDGYNGQFDVKAYLVLDGQGGPGHRASIVKNGVPTGELTLPFVEIRNGQRLQDVQRNYPLQGSALVSEYVHTTGPALLLAFWWGDGTGLVHQALPGEGFAIIENFVMLPPQSAVQSVVAYRQVQQAGRYRVTWSETPDQGAALWLFAFQSAQTIFAADFEP